MFENGQGIGNSGGMCGFATAFQILIRLPGFDAAMDTLPSPHPVAETYRFGHAFEM